MDSLNLRIKATSKMLLSAALLLTISLFILLARYILYPDSHSQSANELSVLANSATIIGTIISILATVGTIVALYVAYNAFQDQIDSNNIGKSSAFSNAILSNISNIKNALEEALYENPANLGKIEYGIRATLEFGKTNLIAYDSQVMPLDYSNKIDIYDNISAQYFTNNILNQLSLITNLCEEVDARDIDLQDIDKKQVQNALRNLLIYYLKNFDPIFYHVNSILQNRNLIQGDWRYGVAKFYVEKRDERATLIEKLQQKGYVKPFFFPLTTGMQYANHIMYREKELQKRMHRSITNYIRTFEVV